MVAAGGRAFRSGARMIDLPAAGAHSQRRTGRWPTAGRWCRNRRARGNPENPLSDDELVDKDRGLATPVLGAPRTMHIEALVASMVNDAAALPALVAELLTTAG